MPEPANPMLIQQLLRMLYGADPLQTQDSLLQPMQPMQPLGPLLEHNQMLDYYRSIDDIVKEGSNPSAKSAFTSSSSRR